MVFVTDKEELKPGLIIFRRADVDHRNWYCRVKLPKADRYKTISLKTADIGVARHLATEQEIRVRVRIESDIPVFNHPFRAVAKEYLATQEARAKRGEISKERPKKLKAVIEGALSGRSARCSSVRVLRRMGVSCKPRVPHSWSMTARAFEPSTSGLRVSISQHASNGT